MAKRHLLALVAGVAVSGATLASAATLGGISAHSLGASNSVVAACDTNGIGVAYTNAYNAAAQHFEVTGVNLSGIDAACNGKTMTVTLASGTTELHTTTVTVSGTTQTVAMTGAASQVVDLTAIVIEG
jgi:hypothetical protein